MLKKCNHLKNEDLISQPIDNNGKEGFAIRGCCGGGCWVIQGIKYCPFCGIKLKQKGEL